MKKTKLFALLLAAPLLASCGKASVKAPKFAKYGDEVKYEKFVAALQKLSEKSDFSKDAKLPSSVFKYEQGTEMSFSLKRNDKVREETSGVEIEKYEVKHDAKNNLMQGKGTYVYAYADKGPGTEIAASDTQESDFGYQSHKAKDGTYAIDVNNKAKEYSKEFKLEKDYGMAEWLDEESKNHAYNCYGYAIDLLDEYDSSDKEDKKNYKFYRNGDNIFTIECKMSDSDNVKDEKDKVIYKYTAEVSSTAQIDMTKGKFRVVCFHEETEVRTFAQDYDEYKKGDVGTQIRRMSLTAAMDYKDVTLKAIDISNYKLYEKLYI